MARLTIDTGIEGNPATGDTLRTAMTKINTNFTEVYSLVRDGSSGLIATDVTNGDLVLQANGTGSIEIDTLSIQNSTITSIGTNSDITITPNGTGNVVLGNFTFNADQTVGASEDNYVFVYDHSTGTIGLEASAAGDVTASSTTTFTNKTFDANGTGNSISNIDIADFTSGVFVDEDNMASNSATAIASQQSIKAYVDAEDANIASDSMTFTNKSGNISQWTNDSNYATQAYVDARDIGDLSVTGSTISAPSNADLTLTTSGTGSVSVDGIQIKGTELSSSDSTQITIKENLHVTGNISGTITGTVSTLDADNTTVSNIEVDNFKAATIVLESEGIGSNDNDTTIPTSAAVKDYVDNNAGGTTGDLAITGSTISAPSNADLTLNAGGTGSVDIEGIQIKGTEISSTDSTQVTIKENLHVTGNITGTINANQLSGTLPAISGELLTGVAKHAFKTVQIGGGNSLVADDPVDTLTIHPGNNVTITEDQSLDSFTINVNGMGDLTFNGSTIISPSNADITLDPAGTGQVVANAAVKFNAGYVEKINTLTSSSTITVDCSAASIHKVTLATNTEFNISNLPTGGTVTLIITQDGTGSRTATFGTDGSTAVKFPGGAPTLSTGAADIDVVTIVNDGTNFLGNCAKNYS